MNDAMKEFLGSEENQYAILQLKHDEDTVLEMFSSLMELERMGLKPSIDHYKLVYTAPLLSYEDRTTMLEELYQEFNVSHPRDFRGHSLSVSDIVLLHENGKTSCHYVDAIGFKELPELLV